MIEVLKQMVEALKWCHGGEPVGTADAIKAGKKLIAEWESQEPVATGMKKLTVTLQDRPIDIELVQYKRMFEAACSALGAVSDALGCEPEEGGAEPLLAAIEELKSHPPQRKPLTNDELYLMYNLPQSDAEMIEFARAIEAAHGIKEQS